MNRPETFEKGDTEAKLGMLYDASLEIIGRLDKHIDTQEKGCTERIRKCDAKFEKLSRWKKLSAALTLVGSFFGGFAAYFAKIKFWG